MTTAAFQWKGRSASRPNSVFGPKILNPVAATDSKGRVWAAWQAYRNGNLEILAAVQNGDKFSPETRVSFSPASDWDPAIATSASGEVAVSWDTYDKSDYDVYFRRLRSEAGGAIEMDPPTPVAAPWKGSTALGWLCDSTLNAHTRPPPTSTAPAFSPGPMTT